MRFDNANYAAAASSAGSTPVTRPKARTNARNNTGNETLRQGRVFALVPGEVHNTKLVVSGIISICAQNAYVLIDSGSSTMCTHVYPVCDVLIGDMTLYVDLLPLSIDHFDFPPPYLISFMKARKLLRKGCRGYLCSVMPISLDSTSVEAIPVVCEFPDVFPNDLPGNLIDREIEFTIDIILGTQPISKTPDEIVALWMKNALFLVDRSELGLDAEAMGDSRGVDVWHVCMGPNEDILVFSEESYKVNFGMKA
ncbi:uncharacterized protein LOC114310810 [Camellia sinensis]|uniref:uncharacterized protein LOC114310810 n=1 Tax=Camellia sinensis TaxID=4442 RepID=UPI001036792E|nr:uncharacterized protein LOC114310810 [Camellia sinensis]